MSPLRRAAGCIRLAGAGGSCGFSPHGNTRPFISFLLSAPPSECGEEHVGRLSAASQVMQPSYPRLPHCSSLVCSRAPKCSPPPSDQTRRFPPPWSKRA